MAHSVLVRTDAGVAGPARWFGLLATPAYFLPLVAVRHLSEYFFFSAITVLLRTTLWSQGLPSHDHRVRC